ncbi:MAG TPA: hypothetical protein VIJ28_18285 [Chloroflexota bacterium]
MKRLLRNTKFAILSVLLALGSLTFAATATPAAHAATPAAYIDAYGQGGGVQVYGWQFTAGVPVRVEVLDSGLLHVLSVQYLTAWQGIGSYGVFDVLMSTSYSGNVWVVADQAGHPSAWAKTYVYPDPYIIAQGEARGVQVTGSGYYPGATVRVEVLDPGSNVLSVQYVTAQSYGIDAGTIRATLLVTSYVGKVYVVTDLGAPKEGWATAYVS